ncbi:MAG TPA: AAA family ATPase [Steroidobacteraceae bacterium]|nr:AAA family ATPase [Steroidobacteraceae bacterium]
MYTSFFGLGEKPFAITPDPRYLDMSERHAEALAHLLYGINEAGGFIQLTGEVGTGKTTVVRTLLEQLPGHADVAVILNPRVTPLEFLLAICEELGVFVRDEDESSVKALVDILNTRLLDAHAKGRRVVVIVDEAQNLSAETLEQVRLLTNLETATQKLLQIILIGQPELREVLGRNELRQLAQRITGRYHLDPLSRDETSAYVRHRLKVAGATAEVFSPSALREIHRLSHGIPRIINVICDRALLAGYTRDQHRVGPALVRQAAAEVYGRPISPPWLGWAGGLAAAAAVAVLGFGVWQLVANDAPEPMETQAIRSASPAVAQAQSETPSQNPPAELAAAAAPTSDLASMDSPSAAGALREPAPEEPPPRLSDVLAAETDTGTDAAFVELFRLWGNRYDPALGTACRQATQQGLECLFQKGSWGQLRALNRPAILTVTDDAGVDHQVVLTGLKDNAALVSIGGESREFDIAEISRYWYGDYLLLWRPQFSGTRSLSVGMRGDEVRWLRRSLAAVQGGAVAEPSSDYFDTELASMVEDFQRRHRLEVDGIAGVQTQIVLATVLDEPGTPLLLASAASGS